MEVIQSMSDSNVSIINALREQLSQQIIGQEALIESLLIALLADGHLLLEGAPGLAKTRAVSELAKSIHVAFQRVQFTPDLLPGDITGTEIYRPQNGTFEFQPGPIFHNLILADEINRAPAKVQAALLEAMAERQVSVGKTTYPLPTPFMVLATQNPIEQEGTYPLPEAQLDRFLLKVIVDYPNVAEEKNILRLVRAELTQALDDQTSSMQESAPPTPAPISAEVIQSARREILSLHVSEAIEDYIVQLIAATRNPSSYAAGLEGLIEHGASPRASLALERTARATAWLAGRDFVTPEDVQKMAKDVLRHRIITSFEAEAKGFSSELLIDKLLQVVPVV